CWVGGESCCIYGLSKCRVWWWLWVWVFCFKQKTAYEMVGSDWSSDVCSSDLHALGEPLETGIPALIRVAPTAERVADAGAARLASLGVRRRRAAAVSAVARAVADGALRLEPGSDVIAAQRALLAIDGIGDHLATTIVMRALR